MEIIKRKNVPEGFQMVSFDAKSLFTNVPLETNSHNYWKNIHVI